MTIRAPRMMSGMCRPCPWEAAAMAPANWAVTSWGANCRDPYVMSLGRVNRAAAAASTNAA